GPIDAGRADLQGVGAFDQIFDIQHGGNLAADVGAILHGHGLAILTLHHDLQSGSPAAAAIMYAHELETHRLHGRLDQARDIRRLVQLAFHSPDIMIVPTKKAGRFGPPLFSFSLALRPRHWDWLGI